MDAFEMTDEQNNTQQTRKPYEAPTVTRVSLRPEEAVLGHCKIVGHSGPVSGSCISVTPCNSLGS
ncbi:MAG TPA: hypothetical protein VJS43_17385 [Candidatus Acidoferrales bacterium]|nr:hypothetical protein [Candidatus Acidoferrales bacterium]